MNPLHHKQLFRFSIIVLTLILSSICIVTCAFWPDRTPQAASAPVKYNSEQVAITPQQHILMVKERNGRLCVYADGVPVLMTDVPVASLPKEDRIALSEGIVIENESALQHLLEDYGA